AIAGAINQDGKEAKDLTDEVTELPNARALRYRFEIEADRARRHGESFAVVMMDLDGFKQINEKLGQDGGNHLLWKVGKVLSGLVRSSDFIGRFAADRFVAMLQVPPDEVEELVERIRQTLEQQDFGFVNSNIFIQMSVGWAAYGTHGETLDELLVAALHPMFQDKARRKNTQPRSEYVRAYDLSQYKVM
ncbi:MAG TPA: GGDEF domain-containing protein, partial [Blastocatellia bacterium]|nr:GGDEF domain-containing protein [Blastocatellia bacterium]